MPRSTIDYRGHKVVAEDGKETGEVTGTRSCQMAGCGGVRLCVKWPDGRRTYPCTKGMVFDGYDTWSIL